MDTTTSQSSTLPFQLPPLRCFACQVSKEGKSIAQCSRCRYAIYCNTDCQKAHWSEHKALCSFLKKSPSYFLNQEPRLRNEYIQHRVDLFNSFPPDCSEEEKVNIEMTSIRTQLVKDLEALRDRNISFLGLTILMESMCLNMRESDHAKALSFCRTPHALHLFLLFAQQLTILFLTRPPGIFLPTMLIKRELLSIWRITNQMMEIEEVCLTAMIHWNEPIPDEIDGVLLAPLLLEQNTTIKSLMLFFMIEVEPLGDDLEGLVWQVFAFADIFTHKREVMEDEIISLKNDVIRRKSDKGEKVKVTIKLFELAKSFAAGILQSKGIDINS